MNFVSFENALFTCHCENSGRNENDMPTRNTKFKRQSKRDRNDLGYELQSANDYRDQLVPLFPLVLDCRLNALPGSEGSGQLFLEEAVRVGQHVLLDVLHVEHLLRQLLGLRLLSNL